MAAKSSGRRALRLLMLSLIALTVLFAFLIKSAYRAPSYGEELGLARVYALAANYEIVSATLLDEDAQVNGRRCVLPAAPVDAGEQPPPEEVANGEASAPAPVRPGCQGQVKRFQASYPRSDVATQQLIERIALAGAPVTVDKQTDKAVTKLLVTVIFPLVMLANLFGIIFVSRGGDSSIADIAGFGTIRRKRRRKRHAGTGVTFADVAGAEEAVAELREVTDYLRDPAKFHTYGASPPKGVLLFGPPGCGKTLLARAVAGETGVPFFSISGAEFVESLVGVGAARVRDLFRQVREEAPAIVFIDEIDAVGRRRGGEGQTGGEREQTVNQLLVELDGFEVTSGIVLMGATNRPDILDPALLRPGRFDRHVTLEAPDVHGRLAILRLHAKGKPLAAEVDLEPVARRTPGFTGADLANVVNEAALMALRQGEGTTSIHQSHLTEAIQRVRHGPQRRGRLMTMEERKRVAYHESGHAIVSAALGRRADVHRVSILARGRSLGQSVVSEDAERVLLSRSDIEAQLAVAMGGIVCEEIRFGEPSTTSEDDLERANMLAREMVGLYGMSPVIGRLRVLSKYDGYLGDDGAVMEAVSSQTMHDFDQEVKRLIDLAEQRAGDILGAHETQLELLAEQLEEEETLEGEALERLLAAVASEASLFPGGQRPNGTQASRAPGGSTRASKPKL